MRMICIEKNGDSNTPYMIRISIKMVIYLSGPRFKVITQIIADFFVVKNINHNDKIISLNTSQLRE